MSDDKKSDVKTSKYKNTSSANLFTEAGRCVPDGVIELSKKDAAKYKELELCDQ